MGGGIRPAGYARHHQAVVIFFIAVILTYISIAWKVIDKNIHPLPPYAFVLGTGPRKPAKESRTVGCIHVMEKGDQYEHRPEGTTSEGPHSAFD